MYKTLWILRKTANLNWWTPDFSINSITNIINFEGRIPSSPRMVTKNLKQNVSCKGKGEQHLHLYSNKNTIFVGFHDIPCSIFLLVFLLGCERTWARQVWVYICQASVKWHWSKKQLLSFPVYPSNISYISCKHLSWKKTCISWFAGVCLLSCFPPQGLWFCKNLSLGSIYYLQFGSCPNTRLIKMPHENSDEWISQFTGFWQPPLYHLHALTPGV